MPCSFMLLCLCHFCPFAGACFLFRYLCHVPPPPDPQPSPHHHPQPPVNFASSEQPLHLSSALLLNTLPCIYLPAWLPSLLDCELPEVKVSPRGAWHGSSTWGIH